MAIGWTCAILLFTVYLFVFEVVSVDVTAISIMVLLGLTTLLAPLLGLEKGLVDNQQIFDGFASNAVISIIAVMIIGAGLTKPASCPASPLYRSHWRHQRNTSHPDRVCNGRFHFVIYAEHRRGRIVFAGRISYQQSPGVPMSRLLMPMGFCAILGGTVTMVGSSPLILLNDLILASNQVLPEDQAMETWSLFSVTPIGVALLVTGIAYFVVAGRYVLPDSAPRGKSIQHAEILPGRLRVDYGLFEWSFPPIALWLVNASGH